MNRPKGKRCLLIAVSEKPLFTRQGGVPHPAARRAQQMARRDAMGISPGEEGRLGANPIGFITPFPFPTLSPNRKAAISSQRQLSLSYEWLWSSCDLSRPHTCIVGLAVGIARLHSLSPRFFSL